MRCIWTEWPEMPIGVERSIITHIIDTSEVETYYYTIQFKDPDGHFGNDTVIVKILWSDPEGIPESIIFQWKFLYQILPNLLLIIEFILIFYVLIYCYRKMKRETLKG